ncbi:hypothetical protein QE152_g38638 [Popillia japonica]|uniref:Uncharacterized protein n=1 Tax=Popillia japonica TaxID=7064 RepID=A0AAW1HW42_POPJA
MHQIRSPVHPLLQKTSFGWIVAGPLQQPTPTRQTFCNLAVDRLDNQLQKFWAIEEKEETLPLTLEQQKVELQKFWAIEEKEETLPLTLEQQKVEQHFLETHQRTKEGRFVVRLPFKEEIKELGTSRDIALTKFHQLEKRFRKNEDMKQRYVEFMQEYEELVSIHHNKG